MLDANDIQIISEIVSKAITENNKLIRADMETMLAKQKAELHGDMMSMRAELHEDMRSMKAELHGDMMSMKQELHEDFMTIIESEVSPKLRLLAEAHETLLEKVDRIERNTELAGRVTLLEDAVKRLNREVAGLKKAQ